MDIKKRLLDGLGHPNSLTLFRVAAVAPFDYFDAVAIQVERVFCRVGVQHRRSDGLF